MIAIDHSQLCAWSVNSLLASQPGRIKKLVNLAKVPHAVLTAHANAHEIYDWATVGFMRQAGCDTSWIRLLDLTFGSKSSQVANNPPGGTRGLPRPLIVSKDEQRDVEFKATMMGRLAVGLFGQE